MVVGSPNFLRAQSGKSLPADGTRFPGLFVLALPVWRNVLPHLPE